MAQSIGMILQDLANMDIFFYVLPFFLVFALIFAILQKLKITGEENRGINAVIALVIGLLSLQYDYVPRFFEIIFPKLGIGLAIILAAMILVGLFVDPQRHQAFVWIFFSLGSIIFLIMLLSSFEDYSWWTGGWWTYNLSTIVAGTIIIVFIILIINSGKTPRNPPYDPFKTVNPRP